MLFLVYTTMCFFLPWTGGFFILDGLAGWSLIYLTACIFLLIFCFEKTPSIFNLSFFLFLSSIFFFTSSSLLSMYLLMESIVPPLLFLLLGFGSQVQKVFASQYLLFYSLSTSLPFLYVYLYSNWFSGLPFLLGLLQPLVFYSFVLAFLMKMPVYFLHLWLPKVHVEAPTSASVVLASLLLKLGTYGFTRFMSSFQWVYGGLLISVSVLGLVICSVLCTYVADTKAVAAYSSVVHMALMLLILLIFSTPSKSAALFIMVAHGFISGLMFYLVGEFYFFYSTRMIYLSNSLWVILPTLAVVFMVVMLSNSGTPPFMGFYGEILGLVTFLASYPHLFFMIAVSYVLVFYYSVSLSISFASGKTGFFSGEDFSAFFSLFIISALVLLPLFY